MKEVIERIRNDMLVQAKGKGSKSHIGTVVGLKKHLYIKLSKRDTPDGKRRYIPLEWVETVEDNTVRLSKSAETVRSEWLNKSAIRHRKSDG
jgi:hypothetical protein